MSFQSPGSLISRLAPLSEQPWRPNHDEIYANPPTSPQTPDSGPIRKSRSASIDSFPASPPAGASLLSRLSPLRLVDRIQKPSIVVDDPFVSDISGVPSLADRLEPALGTQVDMDYSMSEELADVTTANTVDIPEPPDSNLGIATSVAREPHMERHPLQPDSAPVSRPAIADGPSSPTSEAAVDDLLHFAESDVEMEDDSARLINEDPPTRDIPTVSNSANLEHNVEMEEDSARLVNKEPPPTPAISTSANLEPVYVEGDSADLVSEDPPPMDDTPVHSKPEVETGAGLVLEDPHTTGDIPTILTSVNSEPEPDPNPSPDPTEPLTAGCELPLTKPSPFQQCRYLLFPVVLQNAKLRDGFNDLHPDRVEDQINAAISDECCAEFMRRAKEVAAQMSQLRARKDHHGAGGGGQRGDKVLSDSQFAPTPTLCEDVQPHTNLVPQSQPTNINSPLVPLTVNTTLPSIAPANSHPPVPSASVDQTHAPADPGRVPSLLVPGLWFAKMGLDCADILEVTFDVFPDIAAQWQLPTTDDASVAFKPKVCLHLLCLPTSVVASTYQTISLPATPADIANAMWGIGTQWPSRGTLVVEVNSRQNWGRTLLNKHLAPDGPPVDVTSCVRQGRNVVRFIQLGDMSQHMFVLHASETESRPPEHESWQSGKAEVVREGPEALLDDYLSFMASKWEAAAADSGRERGLWDFASRVIVS